MHVDRWHYYISQMWQTTCSQNLSSVISLSQNWSIFNWAKKRDQNASPKRKWLRRRHKSYERERDLKALIGGMCIRRGICNGMGRHWADSNHVRSTTHTQNCGIFWPYNHHKNLMWFFHPLPIYGIYGHRSSPNNIISSYQLTIHHFERERDAIQMGTT